MADDFFDNLVNLSTPPSGDGDGSPSRRLESGIRRLTVLLDDLNRELRLKPLLDRTMDAAIQLTGAERGFLVLRDENGELDYRVANNDASQNIPDAERAASRTIIHKVLDGGEPILVNNIGDQADLKAQRSIAELQVHSVMGAPLRVKDRLLGAAYVDTTCPDTIFTPEDLLLFQSFVHLAAIALENARLLEAERDARLHVQSLQSELRNILESLPLGVILIDSHSQIQFMNRSALDILSHVSLAVGDHLISQGETGQDWRLKIFNHLIDWLEGRNPDEREFKLEARILKYSFFEVLREGNDIVQIGLLLEDVTENRALQRKLIDSEKWSTVNLLAGGIAHEIKTPLGAIRSAAGEIAITLEQTLHEFPAFFQALPDQHHEAFFQMVQLANTHSIPLSSKEKRQRRKMLSESLEQHHLQQPRQHSRVFHSDRSRHGYSTEGVEGCGSCDCNWGYDLPDTDIRGNNTENIRQGERGEGV